MAIVATVLKFFANRCDWPKPFSMTFGLELPPGPHRRTTLEPLPIQVEAPTIQMHDCAQQAFHPWKEKAHNLAKLV